MLTYAYRCPNTDPKAIADNRAQIYWTRRRKRADVPYSYIAHMNNNFFAIFAI